MGKNSGVVLVRGKQYSLRFRVMVRCLLTFLMIAVIFLIYGVYNVFRYREDFVNTNRYVVNFYATEFHNDMESLQNYVNSILTSNAHYAMLSHREISEKNRVWAEYYLCNTLESKASSLQQYGCLFYFDKGRDTMRSQYSPPFSSDELYPMNQALKSWLRENAGSPGRAFVKLGDRMCYLSVTGGSNSYVGFFLDLDRYFITSLTGEEGETQLFFLDGQGQVITWLGENILPQDEVPVVQSSWVGGNDYVLVKAVIEEGTLELALVRPFWQFLRFWWDWRFWVFLVAIPLIGLGMFLAVYRYFSKVLLIPADRLVERVKWMEEKSVKPTLEQSPIVEFQEIEQRVDEMVERISYLQRENYLAQMERQNALVQAYKLQIRPHFYLNCLKTMDALLETGDYSRLRPFILSLAQYMRSRFRDVLDTVTLEEELQTANSYYYLMTLLYNEPILFQVEADESVRQCLIPHFCVQMFLENSFKYARKRGKILAIYTKAFFFQEEGETMVLLRIRDNGDGYSAKQLEEWNSEDPHPGMTTNHIGINNLRYRIRLLFGDKGKVVFYNSPGGGAVTEIILPAKEVESNETAGY